MLAEQRKFQSGRQKGKRTVQKVLFLFFFVFFFFFFLFFFFFFFFVRSEVFTY